MARRSDAELLADAAKKQAALTERMARKADPVLVQLQQAAEDIEALVDSAEAIGEDVDVLEAARDVLRKLAHARVEAYRVRLAGEWKKNAEAARPTH